MAKDSSIIPSPGRYLSPALKVIYNDAIQQLISDLGKEVVLHLQPVASSCPNCLYISVGDRAQNVYNAANPFSGPPLNISFPNNVRCPVCFGTHEIKTYRDAVWHATISYDINPSEIGIDGEKAENILRTKMVSEAWEDLNNCIRATINELDYARYAEPVKTGLGNQASDLKFVETLWKRI